MDHKLFEDHYPYDDRLIGLVNRIQWCVYTWYWTCFRWTVVLKGIDWRRLVTCDRPMIAVRAHHRHISLNSREITRLNHVQLSIH